MALKNVNFFHQHVEKLVIAAAVFVLLIIALVYGVQSFGNPFTADVQGQQVAPDEVDDTLQQAVDRLRSELNGASQIPPPDDGGPRIIPPYAEELQRAYRAPAVGTEQLAVSFFYPGLDVDDVDIPDIEIPTYNIPSPPAPTEVEARYGIAVLGSTNSRQQQLQQIVGGQAPLDFDYVSVEAVFDAEEWQRRLDRSNIPAGMWTRNLGLAGVILIRQTRNEQTGVFEDTTVIPPLPDQLAYPAGEGLIPEYGGGPLEGRQQRQLESTRESILASQDLIARPVFPQLARGQWMPPSMQMPEMQGVPAMGGGPGAFDGGRVPPFEQFAAQRLGQRPNMADLMQEGGRMDPRAEQRAEARLLREQMQWDRQAERLRSQYDMIVRRAERANNREDGMRQPGGFEGPGGFGGRREGGAEFGPRGFDDPRAREEFGGGPGGAQAPLMGESRIQVWAHDLTVQPGRTYRYKVLANVLNPVFLITRLNDEQRPQLLDVLAISPSRQEQGEAPWTEPIETFPQRQFFFTSFNSQAQEASIEVWRVYNGRWRMQDFTQRAGDPIGGVVTEQIDNVLGEREVDYGVAGETGPAVIVDIVESETGNQRQVRLLYLDGNGLLQSRQLDDDRSSERRRELQQIQQQQEAREQFNAVGGFEEGRGFDPSSFE
jgi:hypothetical protein